MAQPVGRCLPEALCRALARFAARREMVNRILKDLLHDQVHATARHWPMQATDRQQERRRLVRVGQRRQIVVLAVSSQFRQASAQEALTGFRSAPRSRPTERVQRRRPPKPRSHGYSRN
jgi:hypothetical protein